MTIGLIMLISVLALTFVVVAVFAFFAREKLSAMHGMLFAMAMAMGYGLFIGLLAGILYSHNLLLSTIIGMGAGLITGTFIGSFYSFFALMEGMLSGIMAGMMGAMLGVMIKPSDWDVAIMLMFTIALSICLLIVYEIFVTIAKDHLWARLYRNPLIIGPLLVLLCIVLYSQTPFLER